MALDRQRSIAGACVEITSRHAETQERCGSRARRRADDGLGVSWIPARDLGQRRQYASVVRLAHHSARAEHEADACHPGVANTLAGRTHAGYEWPQSAPTSTCRMGVTVTPRRCRNATARRQGRPGGRWRGCRTPKGQALPAPRRHAALSSSTQVAAGSLPCSSRAGRSVSEFEALPLDQRAQPREPGEVRFREVFGDRQEPAWANHAVSAEGILAARESRRERRPERRRRTPWSAIPTCARRPGCSRPALPGQRLRSSAAPCRASPAADRRARGARAAGVAPPRR